MRTILVSGSTGFIGSHTCISLLSSGYKIIMLDSFVNSSAMILENIKSILSKVNHEYLNNFKLIECDIRNENKLDDIFNEIQTFSSPIDGVIHFAGLKAVRESVEFPIKYWDNNVSGTITLLKVMQKYNCKKIIFSSSASVYGNSNQKLIGENAIVNPNNPYAFTKSVVEKFLSNFFESDKNNWKIINLRYFNPIGAHPSGKIGENPLGIPNNIFPKLIDVAARKIDKLQIFGNDWDTPDGTGIRDYIHVMDLAEGHVSALDYLFNKKSLFLNLNLGTGKGYSVMELIRTFSEVNNVDIPFEFAPKRKGDVARLIADNRLSLSILNWQPIRNLEDMCRDGWNWQKNK